MKNNIKVNGFSASNLKSLDEGIVHSKTAEDTVFKTLTSNVGVESQKNRKQTDAMSVVSSNSQRTMMSQRQTSKGAYRNKYGYSQATVVTFRKLGIIDRHGNPQQHMLNACKILKIDTKDLECKTFEDFL
jgi:hypothetical protein